MNTITWEKRDTLALFIIPLEFVLLWLISKNTDLMANSWAGFFPLAFKVLSMVLTIVLFHDFLKKQWQGFKKKLWLKLIFCALGAWAMYYVLSGARWLMGIPQSMAVGEMLHMVSGGIPYGWFVFMGSTPIFAPLTEEVIFRHVLFYKFKDHKWLKLVMALVSAFVFGVIHISAFGGNLALTLPYMVVALVYNLIYYFTKNIWYTTTIHFMFNFMQSVWPLLYLPIQISRGM